MDLLGSLSGAASGADAPEHKCSRKGCVSRASWQVLWNNPKVHTPERRKVWLACDEHRGYLADFLKARGFWKDTLPL